MMRAESFHRESDSVLEVVVNGILAAVCINDDFVEERLVSALTDVFEHRREQPQSVIGSVRRVTCLLSILAVRVVLIRAVLKACFVVELNERKSAAVVHLCRQHESYLLCCKLGVDMDNTLYILNGITVAVAVAQTAVDERCCS